MAQFTLDRDRLHDAINMCTAEKLYAWASSLSSPVKLNSVVIQEIGEVKFPLDEERLSDLCNRLTQTRSPQHSGPILIDKSQLHESENNQIPFKSILKDIATTAVQETFNISKSMFNFEVDAVLDKLIICSGEESYQENFNLERDPGTFGSLLIQIPVQGVAGGSSVTVHYKEESMSMQLDQYSQTKYYMAVMAGKRIQSDSKPGNRQDFTIQASQQSPCVMLSAKLIWTDPINSLPKIEGDRLPQFIEAAFQTRQALCGWRHLTSGSMQFQEEAHWVNTTAVNPTGHFFIQSVTYKLPFVDAEQTGALCIPLRHNYCLENFTVTSLVDEDALISKVLHSFSFLDVELILIKKKELPITDWRENALQKVEENLEVIMPPSLEVTKLLPLSLNVADNFAGNLKGGIRGSNDKNQLFHAAFLIQPKIEDHIREKHLILHRNYLPAKSEASYEEVKALIGLSNESDDSKPVPVNLKDPENWEKFKKLVTETHVTRSFHAVSKLTAEYRQSENAEGIAFCIKTMIQLFVKVIDGYLKNANPLLMVLLETLETFSSSEEDFIQSVKLALDQLTASHLALAIEQNGGSHESYLKVLGKVIADKSLKDLQSNQMMNLLKLYLNLDDMETVEQLWAKVCSDTKNKDGQLLLSMILTPKEDDGREALVNLLVILSDETTEALDAVFESVDKNLSIQELTELFMFVVSAQSNELLTSEARLEPFFSVISQVKLETLRLLPPILKNAAIKDRPAGAKMFKKLLEILIENYFEEFVNANLTVKQISEFVDCVFCLRNDELNHMFFKKLPASDQASKCFHSSCIYQTFCCILQARIPIEDELLLPLVKIWIQYSIEFGRGTRIASWMVIRTYFIAFPLDATTYDCKLANQFAKLASILKADCLAEFIVEVHERLKEHPEKLNNPSYINILRAGARRMTSAGGPLFSGSVDKVLACVDPILKLGKDPVVTTFLGQILTMTNLSEKKPDQHKRIMDLFKDMKGEFAFNAGSWAVRDAQVPPNKRLEEFLRSEHERGTFGGMYEARDKAFALGLNLVRMSPYPVRNEVKQVGNKFICELVKMRAITTQLPQTQPPKTQPPQAVPPQTKPQQTKPPQTNPPQTKPEEKKRKKRRNTPTPPAISGTSSDAVPSTSTAPPAVKEEPIETWMIEDAMVPSNPQFEKFLRADVEQQSFPESPLLVLSLAQDFAKELEDASPWPIKVDVISVDGGFLCDVTKTKKRSVLPSMLGKSLRPKRKSPPRNNPVPATMNVTRFNNPYLTVPLMPFNVMRPGIPFPPPGTPPFMPPGVPFHFMPPPMQFYRGNAPIREPPPKQARFF